MKHTALLATAASLGYASTAPASAPAPAQQAAAKKPRAPAKAPELTEAAPIDISGWGTGRGGGQASPYNFDALEVGQSFGVKNKTVREMASPVSAQNRKHKTETKNEAGEIVSTNATKHFRAIEVTAERAKALKGTPLEGSKVLVYRDK